MTLLSGFRRKVDLQKAYRRLLLESEDGRVVLHDLLRRCLVNEDPRTIDGAGRLDESAILMNAGRQLIGTHLVKMLCDDDKAYLELMSERSERDGEERGDAA